MKTKLVDNRWCVISRKWDYILEAYLTLIEDEYQGQISYVAELYVPYTRKTFTAEAADGEEAIKKAEAKADAFIMKFNPSFT